MKQEEHIICDFISCWLEDNWDKVKDDIEDGYDDFITKDAFITECRCDVESALWILEEVCSQSCNDTRYLKELYVWENIEPYFSVIKIDNHYIKLVYSNSTYNYTVSFTEPKTKTITYYE